MEILTSLGPVTVLSVKGDIDSDTFRQLVDKADEILGKGYVNLLLDLHEVDYVSSGGLVALQTITGHAASRGGRAVLSGVTRRVAQVLEITDLVRVFSIFPDLASAKASFAQE